MYIKLKMVLTFSKLTITSSQENLLKLSKKPILKTKIVGLKNPSGRNNSGKITIRHKGAGHKRRYRKVNFFRATISTGVILGIEYDPCRNLDIACVYDFMQQNFFYMLAPKKLSTGDIVESGLAPELRTGNALPLFQMPEGSFIHNIALNARKKAQIARAAGTFAILGKKTLNHAKIILNSGKEKFLPLHSYATLGILGNGTHFLTPIRKAGRSRWLNKRPSVRGVAMNPIDHPHGGGEGKKSGKKMSPWGKPQIKKRKK